MFFVEYFLEIFLEGVFTKEFEKKCILESVILRIFHGCSILR